MIMINENKNLSRCGKSRIDRKNKMDNIMKILLNKIKTEEKNKNKKCDKIKKTIRN